MSSDLFDRIVIGILTFCALALVVILIVGLLTGHIR